ncbi:hypothetical protein [Nocardioides sp. SYSU DS0651]|uniref:hypothetical protein n=1 Tax=Nocardioides sp. SYSU DS0651 TaxID=3415955 RepID=UPI003F4B3068
MRRRWILALGLVLVLVVVAVVVWLVQRDDRTRLERAVALAPESSVRFSWTDWAGVRDEVGVDLSAASSVGELDDFLTDAFDRDLAGTTALVESAPTIHSQLGFSPATIDWELFAQGEKGAIVMVGLPESFDYDALRDRLREAGFPEPAEDDGVWRGGVDVLERLDGPVTPELAAVQIDEDAGVLYGSDDPGYLEDRADAARDEADDGVADVVGAVGGALSATVYTGDHACAALAMSEAEPADRTRAAELVDAAGEVHPLRGFAIAELPGNDVRVAMAFETADQAQTDADSRSALAAGPAPGQGGSFPDVFELGRVGTEGRVLTMELDPVDDSFVVSDLNHGPVLFATC